jgi:cytochrome c556
LANASHNTPRRALEPASTFSARYREYMKNKYISITFALALLALTLYTTAFAHGTNVHGNMAPADAQMKKLHAMMPMFSIASAELESAIKKGDATGAKIQADRILAAAPDLKMSKPHKNIKQREKFVELATKLEKTVVSTVDLASKGDFTGATMAFRIVEETCATCHAKFRD